MRKALIVGINDYDHIQGLRGCIADATAVAHTLARHADDSVNFPAPRLLTSDQGPIGRQLLRDSVVELFQDEAEIALFYFSGHGHVDTIGGYLCGSDARSGDDGLSLHELVGLANGSRAQNRVIILDSCYSGAIGNRGDQPVAEIKDGTCLLTASTAWQAAFERNGSGVFTDLLLNALEGAAANLVGHVTPGSVYAHIDQSLGPWSVQRPVFKTHVKRFISLRTAAPPIPPAVLRRLARHFPDPHYVFALDPTYERDRNADQLANTNIPPPDPDHVAAFEDLQWYVRVNLVRPVGETHMYYAAMNSRNCELTMLGKHYQRLVAANYI